MGSRRFVRRFGGQLAVLVAAVAALPWLVPQPGLFATKLLLTITAISAIVSLRLQLQRTNKDVARFVTAVVQRDFTQSFREQRQGSGFDELGGALNDAIGRLREDRSRRQDEVRFAAALADEAPMPLLAIGPDGAVELANKAARRLFSSMTAGGVDGLAAYGADFVTALRTASPGSRVLTRVIVDGLSQRATLATAQVERLGRPWRIVSIQTIQRELDTAEIAVQADLVRVLTHEIMNSMTPVTSLAETTAKTIAALDPADPAALADARLAAETLARRAEGIMRFVASYREFIRAPALSATRFALKPWADELARVFKASPAAETAMLTVAPIADGLRLDGDPNLLAQVILNLLKNAAEAAAGHVERPMVELAIASTPSGGVRLAVSDNGPGISADLREEVFLPFFTTKRDGTGVGLSFARQIVLLHRGAIGVADNPHGGTTIEVVI